MRQCYKFAEIFDLTRSLTSHGEESLSLNRLDQEGRPSSFTDEVKVGVIKFDNGSRIIAFSASPQAMSVYGGDVGLDEFAKHPNARLLWETAQGRVTWNYDLAVWSSHDGEDTLFNEFAQEARRAAAFTIDDLRLTRPFTIHDLRFRSSPSVGGSVASCRSEASLGERQVAGETPGLPGNETQLADATRSPLVDARVNRKSSIVNPSPPWNIYFRVTLPDAIGMGLVDTINRARGTKISAEQFLEDCGRVPVPRKSSNNPTCATRREQRAITSSSGRPLNAAGLIMRSSACTWRLRRSGGGLASSAGTIPSAGRRKSGNT